MTGRRLEVLNTCQERPAATVRKVSFPSRFTAKGVLPVTTPMQRYGSNSALRFMFHGKKRLDRKKRVSAPRFGENTRLYRVRVVIENK